MKDYEKSRFIVSVSTTLGFFGGVGYSLQPFMRLESFKCLNKELCFIFSTSFFEEKNISKNLLKTGACMAAGTGVGLLLLGLIQWASADLRIENARLKRESEELKKANTDLNAINNEFAQGIRVVV